MENLFITDEVTMLKEKVEELKSQLDKALYERDSARDLARKNQIMFDTMTNACMRNKRETANARKMLNQSRRHMDMMIEQLEDKRAVTWALGVLIGIAIGAVIAGGLVWVMV